MRCQYADNRVGRVLLLKYLPGTEFPYIDPNNPDQIAREWVHGKVRIERRKRGDL